jgi:hypothetical protein
MNFFIGVVISIVYIILKFIEMKYISKDVVPVKYLIRDSFLVYFSNLIGNFVIDQISPIVNIPEEKFVFTGNPEF